MILSVKQFNLLCRFFGMSGKNFLKMTYVGMNGTNRRIGKGIFLLFGNIIVKKLLEFFASKFEKQNEGCRKTTKRNHFVYRKL